MSKAAVCRSFAKSPSAADASAYVTEMQEQSSILRERRRKSILEPFSGVISTYLSHTSASLEMVCRILDTKHGLKVHKSTLFRFIRARPVLSAQRQHTLTQLDLPKPGANGHA